MPRKCPGCNREQRRQNDILDLVDIQRGRGTPVSEVVIHCNQCILLTAWYLTFQVRNARPEADRTLSQIPRQSNIHRSIQVAISFAERYETLAPALRHSFAYLGQQMMEYDITNTRRGQEIARDYPNMTIMVYYFLNWSR